METSKEVLKNQVRLDQPAVFGLMIEEMKLAFILQPDDEMPALRAAPLRSIASISSRSPSRSSAAGRSA